MANETILGLFRDPNEAADAADALVGWGMPRDCLEIRTGTVYPEGAFGEPSWLNRLYYYPLVGGGVGAILAAVVIIAGMLIYSPPEGRPVYVVPPIVILLVELMAAGAIAATVLGIVRLLRSRISRPTAYDPRIDAGYVGLCASCLDERRGEIEATMRRFGATAVVVKP